MNIKALQTVKGIESAAVMTSGIATAGLAENLSEMIESFSGQNAEQMLSVSQRILGELGLGALDKLFDTDSEDTQEDQSNTSGSSKGGKTGRPTKAALYTPLHADGIFSNDSWSVDPDEEVDEDQDGVPDKTDSEKPDEVPRFTPSESLTGSSDRDSGVDETEDKENTDDEENPDVSDDESSNDSPLVKSIRELASMISQALSRVS